MNYLWLIGGTGESVEIAKQLTQFHLPCKITVTTTAAKLLYPQHSCLQVLVGQIPQAKLEQFCRQQKIVAVIDASHPYAVEISQNAIATTTRLQIPYLRYERPCLQVQEQDNVIEVANFQTLLDDNYLDQHRVLLTIGYKPLPLFQSWHQRVPLFARILPSIDALKTAIAAGFTSNRLIAIRPPISVDFEKALWQQWEISLVVTKASGQKGGEEIKRCVAKELGIPLIVISRPQVNYPQQTNDLVEVFKFCRQHLTI